MCRQFFPPCSLLNEPASAGLPTRQPLSRGAVTFVHRLLCKRRRRVELSLQTLTDASASFSGQDGGLLINNPTALAIHECKCLWPNTPLQCVLSLGTGRYETAGRNGTTYTSLKAKLTNVISSATDTEGEAPCWARLFFLHTSLLESKLQ